MGKINPGTLKFRRANQQQRAGACALMHAWNALLLFDTEKDACMRHLENQAGRLHASILCDMLHCQGSTRGPRHWQPAKFNFGMDV